MYLDMKKLKYISYFLTIVWCMPGGLIVFVHLTGVAEAELIDHVIIWLVMYLFLWIVMVIIF